MHSAWATLFDYDPETSWARLDEMLDTTGTMRRATSHDPDCRGPAPRL